MRPRIFALGLALAAGFAGCTSRTLPLPPPDVDPLPSVSSDGLVLVKGTGQENAAIAILNDSTMTGVITTTTGPKGCNGSCPFQASIAARPGDLIRVWQFFETTTSVDRRVPK